MQHLTPRDAAFATEIAGFNTAAETTPDFVFAATSIDDIAEAMRFAREHGHALHVQGTGHGGPHPIRSGVLVSTRRLDAVRIDAANRTATVGAGVKWAAVIEAAAAHGLAPITGSSTSVGVAGYTLGGGFGPLARSHGVSSDYLIGAVVVTGKGVVEASGELLWALRGGKFGLGIVAEMTLRLVPLTKLYAGSLLFEEANIEAALRGWIDYTATADADVTTSVAIAKFPDLDGLPPHLRGRRVLALRFACPGDGAQLAAPLRAIAPIYLDELGDLPIADVAKIHNDPPTPGPSWSRGALLNPIDQDFATALLSHVGTGTDAPFIAAEVRHLGNATARDVPEGSAVGGRGAAFALALIGAPNPELFAEVIPRAADAVLASLAPWRSTEENINFLGEPADPARVANAWPPQVRTKLERVRASYRGD